MQPDAQPWFWYKREGLEPKVYFFCTEIVKFRPLLNKLMQLKRVTDEGLGGGAPRRWAIFVFLRQKIAILSFKPILVTFRTFLKPY